MLNNTLLYNPIEIITAIDTAKESNCYSSWYVTGFVFFLLVLFVIFNEIKRKEIKKLRSVNQ